MMHVNAPRYDMDWSGVVLLASLRMTWAFRKVYGRVGVSGTVSCIMPTALNWQQRKFPLLCHSVFLATPEVIKWRKCNYSGTTSIKIFPSWVGRHVPEVRSVVSTQINRHSRHYVFIYYTSYTSDKYKRCARSWTTAAVHETADVTAVCGMFFPTSWYFSTRWNLERKTQFDVSLQYLSYIMLLFLSPDGRGDVWVALRAFPICTSVQASVRQPERASGCETFRCEHFVSCVELRKCFAISRIFCEFPWFWSTSHSK
jgi:hypothetical protein